jgi:hypothetical protein
MYKLGLGLGHTNKNKHAFKQGLYFCSLVAVISAPFLFQGAQGTAIEVKDNPRIAVGLGASKVRHNGSANDRRFLSFQKPAELKNRRYIRPCDEFKGRQAINSQFCAPDGLFYFYFSPK